MTYPCLTSFVHFAQPGKGRLRHSEPGGGFLAKERDFGECGFLLPLVSLLLLTPISA